MKSDELFDKLADQLSLITDVVLKRGEPGFVLPDVEDIAEFWQKHNKELGDLGKLKKADFCIKHHNEFYFVTTFLKAYRLMEADKRETMLAGLTQSDSGGSKKSFIRNEYK